MSPRRLHHAALLASALGALGAQGCQSSREVALRPFVLDEALTLTLPVEDSVVRAREDSRLLVDHDGLILRVQSIPAEGAGDRRTAASTASALGERYELGEQPGSLSHVPCTYAGSEGAECLLGSFDRDGAQWTRRGAIVEHGERVVWLDVVGPADRAAEVEEWASLLGERAVVGGAS